MRVTRMTLSGLLLLLFTCSWAVAQNAPPRLEFFAEAGGSYLNTGPVQGSLTITCLTCATSGLPGLTPVTVPVTTSVTTAGRLFSGARLRFTRHDALEASYSFSPNHFSYRAGDLDVGSGYSRVDLLSFNYVRYLWATTRFQPFVTAGVGTNRFRGGPGAVPVLLPGETLSLYNPRDNGWQFAWNYGGGADLVLQRHLAFRMELRNYVADQPLPVTGTSHNLVPSGGLVFKFR